MPRRAPIDWSKVIADRAPPVRDPDPQPEVWDLFGGPMEAPVRRPMDREEVDAVR